MGLSMKVVRGETFYSTYFDIFWIICNETIIFKNFKEQEER